jgi:hypothetical protein
MAVKVRLVELVVGGVVVVGGLVVPPPNLLYQPFPLVNVGAMEYGVESPDDVASRYAGRFASTPMGIVTRP